MAKATKTTKKAQSLRAAKRGLLSEGSVERLVGFAGARRPTPMELASARSEWRSTKAALDLLLTSDVAEGQLLIAELEDKVRHLREESEGRLKDVIEARRKHTATEQEFSKLRESHERLAQRYARQNLLGDRKVRDTIYVSGPHADFSLAMQATAQDTWEQIQSWRLMLTPREMGCLGMPFGNDTENALIRIATVRSARVAGGIGVDAQREPTIFASVDVGVLIAVRLMQSSMPPLPVEQLLRESRHAVWGAAATWVENTIATIVPAVLLKDADFVSSQQLLGSVSTPNRFTP